MRVQRGLHPLASHHCAPNGVPSFPEGGDRDPLHKMHKAHSNALMMVHVFGPERPRTQVRSGSHLAPSGARPKTSGHSHSHVHCGAVRTAPCRVWCAGPRPPILTPMPNRVLHALPIPIPIPLPMPPPCPPCHTPCTAPWPATSNAMPNAGPMGCPPPRPVIMALMPISVPSATPSVRPRPRTTSSTVAQGGGGGVRAPLFKGASSVRPLLRGHACLHGTDMGIKSREKNEKGLLGISAWRGGGSERWSLAPLLMGRHPKIFLPKSGQNQGP